MWIRCSGHLSAGLLITLITAATNACQSLPSATSPRAEHLASSRPMMFEFNGQRIAPTRFQGAAPELVFDGQLGEYVLPKPQGNELYIVFRDHGLYKDWIYKASNGSGETTLLFNNGNQAWEMTVDRQPIIEVSNGRMWNMDVQSGNPEVELLNAIGNNDLTLTSKLLNAIPSLAKVSFDGGKTLLTLAVSDPRLNPGKDLAFAKMAIQAGADVNAKDIKGHTPLHYAVYFDKEEMIRLLVDSKADVNAQDSSGDTPLHLAMRKRNETFANYLAQHGANFTIKNAAGQTPIGVALGY